MHFSKKNMISVKVTNDGKFSKEGVWNGIFLKCLFCFSGGFSSKNQKTFNVGKSGNYDEEGEKNVFFLKAFFTKMGRHYLCRRQLAVLLQFVSSKTACYHRHIFCRASFVQRTFKKIKTFFLFSKKRPSSSYFLFFPTFKIFWFFAKKTSKIGWKRHFYEILPFDTHSTAILPPLSILKKIQFFSKHPSHFFSKEPQILKVLRYLTVSVAFYGKIATVWWENISRSVTWR